MDRYLIYCAEDDDAIRELVVYAAKTDGHDVRGFNSADALLSACEKRLPDLVVLDIMMPGTDGLTALKNFREKYASADTRIIMLTAKTGEIDRITGLDAGADDYMSKPFSILELLARIRANLRKKMIGQRGGEFRLNSIVMNLNSRGVTVAGEDVRLTYKEFELLRYLMLNVGIVVEREQLLKEIWETEYFGESRTVDIHIKNLREKLKAEGESIRSVRGVGYMLVNNA